jgi:hypothetical protein
MIFKLYLDRGFEGGKVMFYERLLAFLNQRPLMANVDGEDCDWTPAHPEEGGDSPGSLLLESIRHIARLCGLSHGEAKYAVLMLKYKICRYVQT